MNRAISNIVNLDQQFEFLIKGMMIATESLLNGADSSVCKDWIVRVIENCYQDLPEKQFALKWIEFQYGEKIEVEFDKESELTYRSQVLAKQLQGTQWQTDAEIVFRLAKIKDIQIQNLTKFLPKT